MPPDLESSIAYLEETNNAKDAYFSYTVDPSGENGVIKANKEGLRLYAAELLRRSMEMEARQDRAIHYFPPMEYMISDAGYELICGVLPQYQSRREILAGGEAEPGERGSTEAGDSSAKTGCSLSLLLVVTLGLILLAAYKAFPTLQLWVNIH